MLFIKGGATWTDASEGGSAAAGQEPEAPPLLNLESHQDLILP